MRTRRFFLLCFTLSLATLGRAETQRPTFNRQQDLLLAQFDSRPDPDDLHAIAALGCILDHPDNQNINAFAVAGAYGIQKGHYMPAPKLFNNAFGQDWTDAHNQRAESTIVVAKKVAQILKSGGSVWVEEAGQSDFTAAWVRVLLEKGITTQRIKNHIYVVQHSFWNEEHTTPAYLAFVKQKTNYVSIDDGNAPFGADHKDRGPHSTPNYRSRNRNFLKRAAHSPSTKAQTLWAEATRVAEAFHPKGYPKWSDLHYGGIDFSDTVEAWWILQLPNVKTVDAFWDTFVGGTIPPKNYKAASFPTGPAPCWIENNGSVVMEAENNTQLAEGWVRCGMKECDDETMEEFCGEGWIKWTGKEFFKNSAPDDAMNGVSTYHFEISEPGDYTFQWRSKQYSKVARNDAGNDTYVKFNTGTPIEMKGSKGKKYQINQFTKVWVQSKRDWATKTNFEPHHGEFVFSPVVHYEAGLHEIQIAGRSKGHAIDRIILTKEGVPFNATAKESERKQLK